MTITTEISSLTNSVMQAIDKEMRKNEIFTFQKKTAEVRPIINALVSQIVTDHFAEMARDDSRDDRTGYDRHYTQEK